MQIRQGNPSTDYKGRTRYVLHRLCRYDKVNPLQFIQIRQDKLYTDYADRTRQTLYRLYK